MQPHRRWPVLIGMALFGMVLLATAPASRAEPKLGTRAEGAAQAVQKPASGDRSHGSLRGEPVEKGSGRIPVHGPEWTNPSAGDPGAAAIDPATGKIRFGDGVHGRRPPVGKNPVAGSYRIGSGSEPAAAAPAPAAAKESPAEPRAKRDLQK